MAGEATASVTTASTDSCNLLTLKNRVFAALRDSERSFITDEIVTQFINEAILDLSGRVGLIRKEATGSTTSTGTITLPTDFVELDWLTVDGVRVEWVGDEVFDTWRLDGSTPTNILARIFNGIVETYPVQNTKAYVMRYEWTPTELVADTDTSPLPKNLCVRLVNYARAQCKWIEGEDAEGDRYWSLYTENLPGAPSSGNRERPGPFSLVRDSHWTDFDWPEDA